MSQRQSKNKGNITIRQIQRLSTTASQLTRSRTTDSGLMKRMAYCQHDIDLNISEIYSELKRSNVEFNRRFKFNTYSKNSKTI